MVHQGIEGTGVSQAVAKRGWLPRMGAAVLVLGLTACSSLPDIPDYANPVEWYNSSTDMVGDWFSDETPKIESAGATSVKTETAKKADETFPNLSTVPEKPTAKSTADARAKLKNQLSSDRANARYTDEKPVKLAGELAKPAQAVRKMAAVPAAPKPSAVARSAQLPSTAYNARRSSLWPNSPAPGSSSQVNSTSGNVGRPTIPSSTAADSRPVTVAPRVATMPPKVEATTSAATTTATVAPPAPEIPPKFTLTPPSAAQLAPAPGTTEMATTAPQLALSSGFNAPATFNGQQPMLSFADVDPRGVAETINFQHGSARLSGSDRSRLGRLAQEAINVGAYIRVVGHASMRTGDMDPFAHTLANFNVSLKRANAVASVLIELGVPVEQLIVDAVGDREPLFSEAMPSGEQGNRRAEIYLES